MTIQALREQIAALSKQTRELVENKKDQAWKADDQKQYDDNLKKIDDLKAQVDRMQKIIDLSRDEELEASVNDLADKTVRDSKSEMAKIHAKWLRGGDKALTAEDFAVIRATMSTTTGSEGGYTVPSEIGATIIDALKDFGGMRGVATVETTSTGNNLSFPTSDGTAEEGEIVEENAEATDADPTFGTAAVNAYKFSSKVVAVPIELLQDAAVNIQAFVEKRLLTRIARITNKKFTIGAGSTEPFGVIARASVGKAGASGQTATVIYDDLVDLVHSVDPAYREGGKCVFQMNDATLKTIRKIKDTAGRPIFVPGYDLGTKMPDTILGYPVITNSSIAVMAASAKSIAFGDFKHYMIRDVIGATMYRFTDSAYAKKGQVGFLMHSRHGGNLLDTAAVKVYQNAAS